MATINDLIARIENTELRNRIEKEFKDLTKQKQFGLVFENHEPEMTLLYDYPISRGCKVIQKKDDYKIVSEDIIWEVKKVSKGTATCVHIISKEECKIGLSELICVAKNGEPIYPCLKYVDSIQKAPNSDLWHVLIEADNYHALQLLAYLYPGMVDCIYIDPPYNTGDKSWKYNNDYVDSKDKYPHSKWLAMMESRLLLAKKLLNPKESVLIVTIDEKEYHHLACLLEQIFPEANMQMVSSVTNHAGTSRDYEFSRVNEYIFVLRFGSAAIVPLSTNEKRGDSVLWDTLRRHNPKNIRDEQHPNQFYPIYINNSTHKIIELGEPLDFGVDRFTVPQKEGCTAVFPVRDDGTEMMWGVKRDELKKRLDKGYVRIGKYSPEKPQQYVIQFLSEGTIIDIENGVALVKDYKEDGSIIAYYPGGKKMMPSTQWDIPTHDARDYGLKLNKAIYNDNRFDFPKSLYAVHDVIRLFVANKPNALILDFFAGSGTTLHAVNLLNKEDGGRRRCIMVTNNEISAEEEIKFRNDNLHKGDEGWEKFGIARYVNWPRTICSIKGIDMNGQPIEGDYITTNAHEVTQRRAIKQLSFDIPQGSQGKKVKKQIVSLINEKNMPQNSVDDECAYIVKDDVSTVIIFDLKWIDDFIDEIRDKEINTIYVVTTNNKAFSAAKHMLEELPERKKTVPVKMPMSDGFEANAAFYKLTFLDKEAVSLGSQLDKLLSILWMKAGAHGACPSHVEGEYAIFPKNKMAILIDEYGFEELKEKLAQHSEIETVYIIEDSEDNYRAIAAQMDVKNTYQLYRDYLDNFKINIDKR